MIIACLYTDSNEAVHYNGKSPSTQDAYQSYPLNSQAITYPVYPSSPILHDNQETIRSPPEFTTQQTIQSTPYDNPEKTGTSFSNQHSIDP